MKIKEKKSIFEIRNPEIGKMKNLNLKSILDFWNPPNLNSK